MILNMPVNGGAINSPASQGQTEYTNFLKRKYSEQEIGQTSNPSTSAELESNNENCNNNWKKRHIESEGQTSYGRQETEFSQQPLKSSNQSNTANQRIENNENKPNSSGTFNIIANNTFINDLFAYDANLIVPVSVNSLTDSALTEQPTFRPPVTVNANANEDYDDNGDNWHSNDLLELDHRYNSSLQTEISQLHPTVSLKNETGEVNSFNLNGSSVLTQQQQRQQETHFLLPSKTIVQQNSFNGNDKFLPTTSPTASVVSNSTTSFVNSNENPEQDCDFEDKNLSWLLNFKFDEFPHLNPDVGSINSGVKTSKHQSNMDYSYSSNSSVTYSSTNSSTLSSVSAGKSVQNYNTAINGSLMSERSKSPKNSTKTGKKFEELVMEVTSEVDGNDIIVAENIVVVESSSHRAPKKPPFTYTELIEYALEDKGELTVSGIYQWISDRFPFYKSNDDRWKNSVRHNLSINPHFRKGHKAPQGAGHLWTISSGDSAENVLAWEHKKQRLDLFFKMESINRERLQQHHQKQQQERLLQNGCDEKHKQHIGCQQHQCLYDEAAVAAAAIQQEMLQQNQNNNDSSTQNQNAVQSLENATGNVLNDLPYNDLMTDEELRKTAGQILNGIHREVEVQSVNQTIIGTYQDVLLDNDYLNPIHKDVIVNESGLRHPSHSILSAHCHSNHSPSSGPYYVTEIDPMELGIQIPSNQNHHHHNHHNHHNSEPSNSVSEESDVLFNDEFNLNYFSYNPANDIVA